MQIALAAVFATFYSGMAISAAYIISFLRKKADCDDEESTAQCDGKSRQLLAIFMIIGLLLIFLNWGFIWVASTHFS